MAREGRVASKDGQHFVNIDVTCDGTRYHIEGPPRRAVLKAQEDLDRMRATAEPALSRRERLELMRMAAKCIRDEAKAARREEGKAAQLSRPREIVGGILAWCCPLSSETQALLCPNFFKV